VIIKQREVEFYCLPLFLFYLFDKKCQTNTCYPRESLAPPRDVFHLLDFGNYYFVRDGVSLDNADGISQKLVAILYLFLFVVDGILASIHVVVMVDVDAIIPDVLMIHGVSLYLMNELGLVGTSAPHEGAECKDKDNGHFHDF
jgi:hypothetical protein